MNKPIEELFARLRSLDVVVHAEAGKLRLNAPAGVITPELQAELRQRKGELLDWLSQSAPPAQPTGSIPVVSRSGRIPLSFGQQRLWFLHQMDPQSPVYNIPLMFVVHSSEEGSSLPQLVTTTLNRMVERHEILRTTFQEIDGNPCQVIAPKRNLEIPITDLRGLSRDQARVEYGQAATAELRQPFDLFAGPLFRVRGFLTGDHSMVLSVVMHHTITDGWSLALFKEEFDAIFFALRSGRSPDLAPLPLQYADYAAWQQEWMQGQMMEDQLAYWKQKLAGKPPLLQLPLDRPRPAVQTFNGATQIFSFDTELLTGLKAVANRHGATFFMVSFAAFNVLLHRYSGQVDILVGTSNGNRTRADLERMLGFFVNTQVLRTDLSGDPSFSELIRRVKVSTLEAVANQDLPFERLVHELQPQRDLSLPPLFQVMFIIQNTPLEAHMRATPASSRKSSGSLPVIETGTAKFDLTLYVVETSAGLEGNIEYNTDLFNADTIQRMIQHFERLLRSICADPEMKIAELPMLSGAERHLLLEEWNATQAVYPQEGGIVGLLEAQADRTPDAEAVWCEGRTLTHRELDQRSNQLARKLKTLGVGPDVPVGICIERSLEMVVGLLGILKAGGAYVPLDPAFPEDRLAYMLEDSGAPVVLTQASLASFVRGLVPASDEGSIPRPSLLCLDSDWSSVSELANERLPCETRPEHLAYIIYTSGSTGKPKGVQLPHGAVVNFLVSMAREPGLTPADTVVAITTLSFDIAGLELYLPLSVGARLVIAPRAVAADGAALAALMASQGATVLQATPATWRMLFEAGWKGDGRLKALCGGEAMPRELANLLLQRCGSLWNMYGPTETTIWSTVHQIKPGDPAICIGRPIANTTLYILDPMQRPVPIGASGELWIGGDGLARGYLKRPELTSEKFVPDPFSSRSGQRMYRTGDLARYRPDGIVECLGRADHQVKIRGFRIELGEIETVLAQQARVRSAVVVAHEEPSGDKRLVAYLIAEQPHPTVGDLRSGLKQQLPEYMVPSVFVFLEAFPLTPNGKVDRKALPAPVVERAVLDTVYEAPRNVAEEKIATIWKDVLRVERVGVNDNFFDLGGHSLLLVKVHSQLRQVFSRDIPIVEMFRHTTVGALAKFVSQEPEQAPNFDEAQDRARKLQASLGRKRAVKPTEEDDHE